MGVAGVCDLLLVTETASLPAPRSADLPPSWWAPALSLAERLAAPGLPGAPAEAAAGPAPWAVGDAEGFAQRLAHLGVDRATAAALAAEPAAQREFEVLDGANRYAVLWRVHTASTPATRAKRIAALVQMLAEGRRIH